MVSKFICNWTVLGHLFPAYFEQKPHPIQMGATEPLAPLKTYESGTLRARDNNKDIPRINRAKETL